jgi:sulfite reductase beta subunit-like hemoprotein
MDGPAPLRTITELLSFADVRDIDEFLDGLKKLESGEWTPDQFKVFRLARGTYGQRQADVNMMRVKIPQGILSAEQLERLGEVADGWSRGWGHVTTRQNIQFHFMKLDRMGDAQRHLAAVGLTTREACGNTVRNVTACPLAGVCAEEAFDVTPYGQAVTRHFLRRAQNQALPRKFKIAFSGCPDDCAAGAINDVGCTARVKDGVRGFQVKVAGGLSTTPEDAHLLYDFLPADELIPVMEAVVAVFDKHGNRQNKMRARMKYVVRKLGWEGYRAEFEKELAAIQETVCGKRPIDHVAGEALSRGPSLALAEDKAAAGAPSGFTRWEETNVRAQKQRGFSAVTVRLRRGDVTSAQFRGLAELCRRFGDGMVRLSIDQNVILRFVSVARLESLYLELGRLGLAEAEAGTIADVTSCPGADSCNLAVTGSRELAAALSERLEAPNGHAAAVDAARGLDIKISGCPNSCGQHHIAALGFHGGMRRVGGKIVPEYTLHLGGGIDAGGATFGRQVAKIPARRTPEAVLRLLQLYVDRRTPGETALAFFRRISEAEVRACLADLAKIDEATASADDYLDLGETKEFVVKTGPGECAV